MTTKELLALSPESRAWVKGIKRAFVLESHHERLLLICGQALDRISEARQQLLKDGTYYKDRHGVVRTHPAVKVEQDSKIIFSRGLRELDLDSEVAPAMRPPAIRSNRTLKSITGGKGAA